MLVLGPTEVRDRAPLSQLIESLREAFRSDCRVPPRQVVPMPGGTGERLLLSMPAFQDAGGAAIKLATVVPDNRERDLPTIQAVVVVFSPEGTPTAVLDGGTITRLRTGAASALASTFLSRSASGHLALLGTGALAPVMAAAHCVVRPIGRISVWGRRAARAAQTVDAIRSLLDRDVDVLVAESAESAVSNADIVCCATSSPTPVLQGKWLRPGTFVDLVGSFSPARREADDEVVRRSRIFVDTFEGALSEAGDILDPLARGVIERARVEAELADLVCGRSRGRIDEDEITVFKSVGTALEDLAAARLVVGGALRRADPLAIVQD